MPTTLASKGLASYDELKRRIRIALARGKERAQDAVEREKVRTSWEIGKLIQSHILLNKQRADYGKQVLKRLSADLEISERELYYTVEFARTYPILPVPAKLSWSHYRELLAVNDEKERRELAEQVVKENWNQMRTREEIQRRWHLTQESTKFPEITPGPLYTYPIIRLKDRLKIDLGFGIYHDLSEKDAKKFKEGDIVHAPSSHGSLSVIASPPKAGKAPPKNLADPPRSLAEISDLYTYHAIVTQVVDGDTFHALIDLGFETTLAQRVRLRRIDAPEILTADGKEAKTYLEKILSRDKGRILMKSVDIDQHGRPIADVWVKGKPVDQELLDKGLAVRMSE